MNLPKCIIALCIVHDAGGGRPAEKLNRREAKSMLANTPDTYRKLRKVYTGTAAECRALFNTFNCLPGKDLKACTRGRCSIIYYRPYGGRTINDKVAMYRWNEDGTVTLYL